MPWLPSAIAAGASILGSALGYKSTKDSQKIYDKAAKANIQYQKEFAQHGLRWRVDDAKAAGIHPLAAMGASTAQFTPQINTDRPEFDFQRAGQDLGRAITANWTKPERKLHNENLRIRSLQGDILALQKQGLALDLEERYNKPFPEVNSTQSNKSDKMGIITETDLGSYQHEPHPYSDSLGIKAAVGPYGQYKVNRRGIVEYMPDTDVIDWVSESIPAAMRYWSNEAKYAAAMTWGSLNGSKFYDYEKKAMESRTGQSVYWDWTNMAWRLSSRRPSTWKSIRAFYRKGINIGWREISDLFERR